MIQIESYKHKLAKELLYKWLRESEDYREDNGGIPPLSWRPNWGVHLELPFHEKDWQYYFEAPTLKNSSLLMELQSSDAHLSDHQCYFEPGEDRGKILFVPDITVFHKGTPKYLVEVVHKSAVSDKKLKAIEKYFYGYYVEIVEISADWILNQMQKPTSLKITRHITL